MTASKWQPLVQQNGANSRSTQSVGGHILRIANGPGVHLLCSSNKVSGEGSKCRGEGLLWYVRQKALQKMHLMRTAYTLYLGVSVPYNTGGHGALLSMGVYIAFFSVSETFS